MSEIPDDNTCHTPNHVWMQGCMTCFEERIRADEREQAAQLLADAGYQHSAAFLRNLAAARGEDTQ